MDIMELAERIDAIDADEAVKSLLREHVFLYKQALDAFTEDRCVRML